jgi:DNA-binding NtrC family response regulator
MYSRLSGKSQPERVVTAMSAILLIEDDHRICEVIDDYLQGCFATVHCAHTGEEAVQMLAKHHYDLAIIDVTLPGMSGLDLAEIAANGNISVLLISGYPDLNFKLHQYQYPHLMKPFPLDALRIAAAKAISEHTENLARVKASAAQMLATTRGLRAAMVEADRLRDAIRTQQKLGRWEAVVGRIKSAAVAAE